MTLAKFTVKSWMAGVNKALFTPEEIGFWFIYLFNPAFAAKPGDFTEIAYFQVT